MAARAKKMESPRDQMAALEAHRARLREDRAELEARPRPIEEATVDLDMLIARAASEVTTSVGGIARGSDHWHDVLFDLRRIGAGRPHAPSVISLLCATAPETVRTWLRACLADAYAGGAETLATPDRDRELARIDAELAAVEAEMADRWWLLLSDGFELPPPDVLPAVLLGIDASTGGA